MMAVVGFLKEVFEKISKLNLHLLFKLFPEFLFDVKIWYGPEYVFFSRFAFRTTRKGLDLD